MALLVAAGLRRELGILTPGSFCEGREEWGHRKHACPGDPCRQQLPQGCGVADTATAPWLAEGRGAALRASARQAGILR